MKPAFRNRPNRPIPTPEGETIWHSRSVALVGEVCAYNPINQQWYVLLVKRGAGTPDFQGYWCLPCGYLDWDESLTEGLLREVFEECGLFLPALSMHSHFKGSHSSLTTPHFQQAMPWSISDGTKNNKQNISMHYAVFFAWQHHELPMLSDAHCEPNEVAGIQWTPLDEAKEMTLAFNHQERIHTMCQQLEADMQALIKLAHS